jgi:uncharacterized protein (DUF305 family)
MLMKKLTVLLVVVAASFTLAGCGSNDETGPAATTQTAPNGDKYNDADVDFATNMIPHHAQALQMVDLTTGRSLDPEVAALTEDIHDAQGPEIETMTDLTAWGEPVPETPRDHGNAGHDGTSGMDMSGDEMPGMMSSDELAELEAASDAQFQDMWLTMMIAHHQGAIEMAKTEQTKGTYTPAINLAKSIETSQQQEISHMGELLDS